MAFLFELLAQLVVEIVGQVLFEILASLGWESIKDSTRREREATPFLAGTGHLLLGAIAGILSLLIVPQRMAPHSPLPGLSLLLSPIGSGIAMHWLGEFWRERGRDRPILFSFRAGALFAFGMALVRFVYVGLDWRPLTP